MKNEKETTKHCSACGADYMPNSSDPWEGHDCRNDELEERLVFCDLYESVLDPFYID